MTQNLTMIEHKLITMIRNLHVKSVIRLIAYTDIVQSTSLSHPRYMFDKACN